MVMDLRVGENQRFEIKIKSHYSYLATHSLCISSPRYSTGT